MNREIEALKKMGKKELEKKAKEYRVPVKLVEETKKLQRLPVVNFAAGGIATPADSSMLMQMGSDGVFVGSGIFKSENPEKFAKAIVEATMNFSRPERVLKVSYNLGEAMHGIDIREMEEKDKMQTRST
jgi:pyridoxal 5'-phosphate synthase pdxS subunit